MAAAAPGQAGTTAAGVTYPAVTGPAPYGVQVTDVAAIAAEGAEDLIEKVIAVVGPTGAAVVGVLSAVPKLLSILLTIRDPLNGKNLTRVAEAQNAYATGGATGIAFLIGRFNAGTGNPSELEPDWLRQLCQFYAILLGVPLAAFPS